jgi:hypothetical protein
MNTNLVELPPSERRATPSRALPRLLVVTYFSPAARHGGAVCVQNLLDGYPIERLAWMHHEEPVSDPASPWSKVAQWSIALLRRPNRFGLRGLKEYGNWTIHAARMAHHAAERAESAGIQAVLGIGPGISVWTSYLIAKRLGVPLHLWIHDDPEAYAVFRGEYGTLLTRIRQCFMRAYQGAAARYVISEPMRVHYRKMTGCNAVVLPPSLGPLRPQESGRTGAGQLRIGVAGAIAGTEVWEAFVLAMERLYGAAPAGRRPEIIAFCEPDSVSVPEGVRERGWVTVRGWQPVDVVDRELATMDYLYMPLWFSEDRRLHAATSFSTKFVSYLRAGVPILCHVPGYSAVAEFARRCPVGPVLDTVDIPVLADQLRDVLEKEDWRSRYAAARPQALAEFDHATLVRRFHESLRANAARPSEI